MGLTHHPFSALFTTLPVQLQHKQLNQHYLTRGNTGKQQWPCPCAVTFSVSNKRKVIPVLEAVTHPNTTDTIMIYQNQKFSALGARYSEDSNVPMPAWSGLCQADTVNTTVLVHGSAGLLPTSFMTFGCDPVQFLRNTWDVFYISFVCRGTPTQHNSFQYCC